MKPKPADLPWVVPEAAKTWPEGSRVLVKSDDGTIETREYFGSKSAILAC